MRSNPFCYKTDACSRCVKQMYMQSHTLISRASRVELQFDDRTDSHGEIPSHRFFQMRRESSTTAQILGAQWLIRGGHQPLVRTIATHARHTTEVRNVYGASKARARLSRIKRTCTTGRLRHVLLPQHVIITYAQEAAVRMVSSNAIRCFHPLKWISPPSRQSAARPA